MSAVGSKAKHQAPTDRESGTHKVASEKQKRREAELAALRPPVANEFVMFKDEHEASLRALITCALGGFNGGERFETVVLRGISRDLNLFHSYVNEECPKGKLTDEFLSEILYGIVQRASCAAEIGRRIEAAERTAEVKS